MYSSKLASIQRLDKAFTKPRKASTPTKEARAAPSPSRPATASAVLREQPAEPPLVIKDLLGNAAAVAAADLAPCEVRQRAQDQQDADMAEVLLREARLRRRTQGEERLDRDEYEAIFRRGARDIAMRSVAVPQAVRPQRRYLAPIEAAVAPAPVHRDVSPDAPARRCDPMAAPMSRAVWEQQRADARFDLELRAVQALRSVRVGHDLELDQFAALFETETREAVDRMSYQTALAAVQAAEAYDRELLFDTAEHTERRVLARTERAGRQHIQQRADDVAQASARAELELRRRRQEAEEARAAHERSSLETQEAIGRAMSEGVEEGERVILAEFFFPPVVDDLVRREAVQRAALRTAESGAAVNLAVVGRRCANHNTVAALEQATEQGMRARFFRQWAQTAEHRRRVRAKTLFRMRRLQHRNELLLLRRGFSAMEALRRQRQQARQVGALLNDTTLSQMQFRFWVWRSAVSLQKRRSDHSRAEVLWAVGDAHVRRVAFAKWVGAHRWGHLLRSRGSSEAVLLERYFLLWWRSHQNAGLGRILCTAEGQARRRAWRLWAKFGHLRHVSRVDVPALEHRSGAALRSVTMHRWKTAFLRRANRRRQADRAVPQLAHAAETQVAHRHLTLWAQWTKSRRSVHLATANEQALLRQRYASLISFRGDQVALRGRTQRRETSLRNVDATAAGALRASRYGTWSAFRLEQRRQRLLAAVAQMATTTDSTHARLRFQTLRTFAQRQVRQRTVEAIGAAAAAALQQQAMSTLLRFHRRHVGPRAMERRSEVAFLAAVFARWGSAALRRARHRRILVHGLVPIRTAAVQMCRRRALSALAASRGPPTLRLLAAQQPTLGTALHAVLRATPATRRNRLRVQAALAREEELEAQKLDVSALTPLTRVEESLVDTTVNEASPGYSVVTGPQKSPRSEAPSVEGTRQPSMDASGNSPPPRGFVAALVDRFNNAADERTSTVPAPLERGSSDVRRTVARRATKEVIENVLSPRVTEALATQTSFDIIEAVSPMRAEHKRSFSSTGDEDGRGGAVFFRCAGEPVLCQ